MPSLNYSIISKADTFKRVSKFDDNTIDVRPGRGWQRQYVLSYHWILIELAHYRTAARPNLPGGNLDGRSTRA